MLALFPVVPGEVSSFLKGVVTQVQGKAGIAGIAGIIGLLIVLWSASGYVAAFMRASNAIYDVDEGRPVWKTVPVRILTTLALVIMLVIAAAIVIPTGLLDDQLLGQLPLPPGPGQPMSGQLQIRKPSSRVLRRSVEGDGTRLM